MPNIESINNLKSKETKICTLYKNGESSNKIAVKLQLSKSSVKKVLKKHNITIRDSSISHMIYNCDETLFKFIDSHEKAYWIGFLTADATITNGSLKLALATKDITHIDKFRKFMKSNHPIHTYRQLLGKSSVVKNKSKNYYYGIISIHSAQVIKDLSQYSITTNKSFTTKFGKNIPDQFINSYMAGLVDADGFVTVSNDKITIGFLSHNDFATNFNTAMHKNLDLSDNKLLSHHTNDKLKIVRFSGAQVFNISNFLYANTPTYLERKKNKISNFFEKDSL